MTSVAFHGLRGGVGTTSTVAGVALAMHRLGCSLVVVDLAPTNLLRWHLGLGGLEPAARLPHTAAPAWRDQIHVVADGFALLSLGRYEPMPEPADWHGALASAYDWILVDAPAPTSAGKPFAWADLAICTLNADAACAILLSQSERADNSRLLITQYDPLSQLQRDVRLLLQHDYADCMAPTVIHRDEAVTEALATGQAVGAYRGDSMGAQDMQTIATWLLAVSGVAA